VTYGLASAGDAMHESNAREQGRATGRVAVPLGAIIRAEGSVCSGALDRCAVGLSCTEGRCLAIEQ